jgi:hypothetical protein
MAIGIAVIAIEVRSVSENAANIYILYSGKG